MNKLTIRLWHDLKANENKALPDIATFINGNKSLKNKLQHQIEKDKSSQAQDRKMLYHIIENLLKANRLLRFEDIQNNRNLFIKYSLKDAQTLVQDETKKEDDIKQYKNGFVFSFMESIKKSNSNYNRLLSQYYRGLRRE